MIQETLETIILGYITKELKNEIEIGRQVKLAKTIIQTLHINGFLDQNKKLVCNENELENLNEFLQDLSNKRISIRRKVVLLKKYINNISPNVDDIIIESVETTSHNTVKSEQIFESIITKLRFIDELNKKYINDDDFGRNVRKLLNVI